jgi:hypothetical protein
MHKPPVAIGSAGLLLLVFAIGLQAQVCTGFPKLQGTPFRVTGEGLVNGNAKGLNSTLGGGGVWFGSLSVGLTDYTFLNGSSNDIVVRGGREFSLGILSLCPIVSTSIHSGPFDVAATGIDFFTFRYSVGGAAGLSALSTPGFSILPSIDIRLAHVRTHASGGPDTVSVTNGRTYGVMTAGVGFVINGTVTIRPAFSTPMGLRNVNAGLPFELHNTKPTLSIDFAFCFGRKVANPI